MMDTAAFSQRNRALENFHIVLWLVKDMCWCMLWKPLALFMIIPTFIFALFITYNSRNSRAELFNNIAVLMWILANSTWMIGEFYFQDGLKNIALVFFISGLLLISYFYTSKLFKNTVKNN
jgi:hypothetical protein